MDGNARWAEAHGPPVLEGHRRGAKTLKETVKSAVRPGVKELTAYAFSTEDWTWQRGRLRALSLRARDVRPGSVDSHERRGAHLELPALAVRLLGAHLHRRAVAGLLRGRPARSARGVHRARAALRGALMAVSRRN